MKIGLVCPYNISKGGGVQEGVLAIQREMQYRGHVAKIVTPLPRGKRHSSDPSILYLGTAADIKSPFATTAQVSVSVSAVDIEKLLQNEAFDILHFHEPWVPIMSRQLLTRSTSINIGTFHAHLPDTMVSKTIEAVITPYTKSLLKNLHALTAVSEAASEYVQTLTSEHIEIIPNGIDLAKFKPANIRRKSKSILYIGRLEKRKGLKYLLKAFQQLQLNGVSADLIIAGDGPDRKKLEDLVYDMNLRDVKFKGYISESEKVRLLKQANIFCSPALYGESFGIVLLEAMAAGTPIIAGDNPGYRCVMKGRGMLSLVNPRDTDDFARRLAIFLDDMQLRDIWCDWAQDYTKQFDYKLIVDRYLHLYQQLLTKHKK